MMIAIFFIRLLGELRKTGMDLRVFDIFQGSPPKEKINTRYS
jgi:hypothetical protein